MIDQETYDECVTDLMTYGPLAPGCTRFRPMTTDLMPIEEAAALLSEAFGPNDWVFCVATRGDVIQVLAKSEPTGPTPGTWMGYRVETWLAG